jgi:hypothetical protein
MNLTSILDPGAEMTQPKYATAHLEFRRDTIEPLSDEAVFEVDTPAGTFRMTKHDFHATFPEIVSSVSYRDLGLYHYPMIPYKAFRFLVREPKVLAANGSGSGIDQQVDGASPDGREDRVDQEPSQ